MIASSRLARENIQLKRALKQQYAFPNIVGKSDRMLRILDLVTQVAPSRATILITGETGTGKELIAKAIHAHSARANQLFVPVNTGSVPAELMESALFGHVKGAFTSAIATQKGYFEIANRGTIFFDEIGTISPETQAKLLRVIQEREFMPVGSTETIKVDVRIIAATNADLRKLVEEGKFREDLYYRLNVIPVQLAPLRERREDVLPLARHFLRRYAEQSGRPIALAPEAEAALLAHPWRGNVRELENAIERGVVLARGDAITPEDLLLDETAAPPPAGGDGTLQATLDQATAARIRSALAATGGQRTEAARALGIDRTTLYRLMKRYGLTA